MSREKWKRTGLLNGVSEDFKDTLADALENQKLFNEKSDLSTQFTRISIPLVRRVLPVTNIKVIIDEESRKLLKLVKFKKVTGLDEEAEYVAELSQELVNIINAYDTFHFYAFGLVDDDIVVYGENDA